MGSQVIDKDTDEVMAEIESEIYSAAASIVNGEGFSFDVPSRTKGNQVRRGATIPHCTVLLSVP